MEPAGHPAVVASPLPGRLLHTPIDPGVVRVEVSTDAVAPVRATRGRRSSTRWDSSPSCLRSRSKHHRYLADCSTRSPGLPGAEGHGADL